jgi:hypothetical protein
MVNLPLRTLIESSHAEAAENQTVLTASETNLAVASSKSGEPSAHHTAAWVSRSMSTD